MTNGDSRWTTPEASQRCSMAIYPFLPFWDKIFNEPQARSQCCSHSEGSSKASPCPEGPLDLGGTPRFHEEVIATHCESYRLWGKKDELQESDFSGFKSQLNYK